MTSNSNSRSRASQRSQTQNWKHSLTALAFVRSQKNGDYEQEQIPTRTHADAERQAVDEDQARGVAESRRAV